MSAIDIETGLPELPEGHRWSVYAQIEPNQYIFNTLERITGKHCVVIEKVTPEREVTWLSKPHWWSRARLVRRVQTESWYTAPLAEPVVLNVLDAEAVLAGAKKALKRWKKAKAAHALIGAYPTKRLAVQS